MGTGTIRPVAVVSMLLIAAVLTPGPATATLKPKDPADWLVTFSIQTVGLQSEPEVDADWLRTESDGAGTIRFEKKPKRGKIAEGKVQDFRLDQYEFLDATPETAAGFTRFVERPEGRKVELKIGSDTVIRNLPFVVSENQGHTCTSEARNVGKIIAVEGQLGDGLKVKIHDHAHLACRLFARTFLPDANPQQPGGLNTVNVTISDPVEIAGNAP